MFSFSICISIFLIIYSSHHSEANRLPIQNVNSPSDINSGGSAPDIFSIIPAHNYQYHTNEQGFLNFDNPSSSAGGANGDGSSGSNYESFLVMQPAKDKSKVITSTSVSVSVRKNSGVNNNKTTNASLSSYGGVELDFQADDSNSYKDYQNPYTPPQSQNQYENQPQSQNQYENQPQSQNQYENQPQSQNQYENQPSQQWAADYLSQSKSQSPLQIIYASNPSDNNYPQQVVSEPYNPPQQQYQMPLSSSGGLYPSTNNNIHFHYTISPPQVATPSPLAVQQSSSIPQNYDNVDNSYGRNNNQNLAVYHDPPPPPPPPPSTQPKQQQSQPQHSKYNEIQYKQPEQAHYSAPEYLSSQVQLPPAPVRTTGPSELLFPTGFQGPPPSGPGILGPGPSGGPGPFPPPPPPIRGSIDYILIPLILIGIAGPIFVVTYVILGSYEAKLAPFVSRSLGKSLASYVPALDSVLSTVAKALEKYECMQDATVCKNGSFRKRLQSPDFDIFAEWTRWFGGEGLFKKMIDKYF